MTPDQIEQTARQIERAYPGYHVWASDEYWWYATRTSARARGESPTVHGANPDKLTTELAAEESPCWTGPCWFLRRTNRAPARARSQEQAGAGRYQGTDRPSRTKQRASGLTVSLLATAGVIAFSLPRRAREQASPIEAVEPAMDQAPELSAA